MKLQPSFNDAPHLINKMENKTTHELEEKLTLLEKNNYPELLGRVMLKDCLEILANDYRGLDFEEQINRYLVLERKYK